MSRTDKAVTALWAAVCVALVAMALTGCATTATTQVMETVREDGVPEVSRQTTWVMAFGKSSIESAQPDTLNEWTPDGGGQLASGSTVQGMKAEEGIMAAILEVAINYIAGQSAAQTAQTTMLQDIAAVLGALRPAPLGGMAP